MCREREEKRRDTSLWSGEAPEVPGRSYFWGVMRKFFENEEENSFGIHHHTDQQPDPHSPPGLV